MPFEEQSSRILQPRWSGVHPDLVILKPASNIDIGDMAGEILDRRKTPYLSDILELFKCRMEPTDEFEFVDTGEVAQIWRIEKDE